MGKKNKESLGRALINNHASKNRHRRTVEDNSMLHTTEVNDGYDWGRLNLQSVTAESSLQEFLSTAELAEKEFIAEKLNIKYVKSQPTEVAPITSQPDFSEPLTVPRRPKWAPGRGVEEQMAAEKEAFLDWRRHLNELQGRLGAALTPYERNLELWRQLWRTVERADLVLLLLDARNPLLLRCEDLERYAREEGCEVVLVLNKADLVEEYERRCWARYFKEQGTKAIFFSAAKPKKEQKIDEAEIDVIPEMSDEHDSGNNSGDTAESDDENTESRLNVNDSLSGKNNLDFNDEVEPNKDLAKNIDTLINNTDENNSTLGKIESGIKSIEIMLKAMRGDSNHPSYTNLLEQLHECPDFNLDFFIACFDENNPSQETLTNKQKYNQYVAIAKKYKEIFEKNKKDSKATNKSAEEIKYEYYENLALKYKGLDKVEKDSNISQSQDMFEYYLELSKKAASVSNNANTTEKIDITNNEVIKDKTCETSKEGETVNSEDYEIYDKDKLIALLKSYDDGRKLKNDSRLTVGMIGYPNVGKSSTVNVLMQVKKVSVSSMPGHTRHVQSLLVGAGADAEPGEQLELLDCPGLVLPAYAVAPDLLLTAVLPIDQMRAHEGAAARLCELVPRRVLQRKYGLLLPDTTAEYCHYQQLLTAHAYNRGFMSASGQPDVSRSARLLLKEAASGGLRWAVLPPGAPPPPAPAQHAPPADTAAPTRLPTPREARSVEGWQSRSAELDRAFFARSAGAAHAKGKPVYGISMGGVILQGTNVQGGSQGTSQQGDAQGTKPWKLEKKHANKNKREKLRRMYAHLDQH